MSMTSSVWTTAAAADSPARTWDPAKFQIAFTGRRLISFDELYKYYRYDGVKSRVPSLHYDPYDGLKIALVLTGLMLIIAGCMAACHYRDRARRRRLSRQTVDIAAVEAAAAEGADVESLSAEGHGEDAGPDKAVSQAAAAESDADEEAKRPLKSELLAAPPRQQQQQQQQQRTRKQSESVVKVHFHRSQGFEA